ncbi:MAG: AAA family ATPase [Rubrivivax sp.]|nr:AAA family ATPase [Rubrivivax sp.]
MLTPLSPQLLSLGMRVRIDAEHQRLWRDGQIVDMRPKAWQALCYLLQRPGQLIPGQDLLEALWPDQEVSSKTLTNLMGELRTALGDDSTPPQHLQTLHRRGYRLLLQPASGSGPAADLLSKVDGPAARSEGADSALGGAGRAPALHDRPGLHTALPGAPTRVNGLSRPGGSATVPAERLVRPAWAGRDKELLTLTDLLRSALAGHRQMALVAADPGVGKTALLDRLIAESGSTRAVAARGACLELASAREPFAPVLALLAELCSGPLAGQTSAALRRCAPTWLVQLPWLVPAQELPGLRKSLAGMGQGRMLREFSALLRALTEHTPLVLVLEDLHWADEATIDLLQQLAGERTPASLLLLASYQPLLAAHTGHPVAAFANRLVAHDPAAELRLQPLKPEAIESCIAQRLGCPALARQLAPWAERQSMGIPLYLGAALHHLIDTAVLAWECGRWQLIEPPPQHGLAEPLRRLIAARFARLDGPSRELLDAASVVGMQVPVQLLAAVLQRDPVAVEQACSALARQGEFVRAGLPAQWPDGSRGGLLQFTHDIYRRALYEGLSPGLRQVLYRRLAERLEAGWGDQVARVAGQLASAYARAAMPEATARVLEMTAHLAAQRLSYAATIDDLNDCLHELARTPASAKRDATELRVQLMLGNMSLHHHGVTDPRTLAAFERARQLARQMGAQREQIRAQLGAIIGYSASFRPADCLTLAQETVVLAEAGQPSLRAVAHHYAGLALVLVGRLPQALWHQDRSLSLTPDPLVPLFMDVPASALVHRGRNLCWMGRTEEGLASIEAGIARSREVNIPADLVLKLYWAGDLLRLLGQPRAEALLAEAQERAELYDLPGLRAAARVGLACCRPPAERDTALIEALAPAYCRPGDHLATLMVSLALTEAHLAQARVAQAQAAWARGRAVTPADTLFDTEVLRLQGALVQAVGGPPEEAESLWRAGLALAQGHHASLYALRCATDACRSLMGRGRDAEGRALLEGVMSGVERSDRCLDQQAARRLLAVPRDSARH